MVGVALASWILGFLIITTNNFQPSSSCELKTAENNQNEESPLYLTPRIKSGRILEAQESARVKNQNFSKVLSYSGFLTVNPTYNSNLFFWFFPAQKNSTTAPLVLWLQGGPGESAMFGLFSEHGPFRLDSARNVHMRKSTWTLTHNVIYMDSPVGAGYSFTDNDKGYARTQEDVATNLYEALTQFFQLFPQYRTNDFYVAGESYGGKYVPSISFKIHKENQKKRTVFPLSIIQKTDVKINLKGLAMGNAFTDPVSTLDYGNELSTFGLIDSVEKAYFQLQESKARQLIQEKKFVEAFDTMDKLILGSKSSSQPSYYEQVTGLQAIYNIEWVKDPPELLYFKDFMDQPKVRQSVHAGNKTFRYFDLGGPVAEHLEADIYQSVKPWVEELLDAKEGYRVMYYTGQLDAVVGVQLINNLINSLKWSGATKFQNATRKVWRVNDEKDKDGMVAGYSKTYSSLTTVVVRNAGHRVPFEQPGWALDMINKFTGTGARKFGQ